MTNETMKRKIYACWIYVSDLQKSKQFYQDLGFEVKLTNGDWIEFNFGKLHSPFFKDQHIKVM